MKISNEADTITFYSRNADKLSRQYESLDPLDLYGEAAAFIPRNPGKVLDVAAGSGRDAAWLEKMGHFVVAVEPAESMRARAEHTHTSDNILWMNDRLPHLTGIFDGNFDFILAAAVWMHLDEVDRPKAMRRLHHLLKPGGRLLVTLRHGRGDPLRPMHHLDTAAEMADGMEAGFRWATRLPAPVDKLGRSDVHWTFIGFEK